MADPTMPARISREFHLTPEDARKWFAAVKVTATPLIKAGTITTTLAALADASLITPAQAAVSDAEAAKFVDAGFARIESWGDVAAGAVAGAGATAAGPAASGEEGL